jgi:cell division initiation protein
LEASFSKSFRGYDVSEVDAYVQSVQDFETESNNTIALSNQKVTDLEVEVARLREIESSLFRALKLAEESQQNFAAKMEKEAKSILDKATKEAEAIKKKADAEALKQALLTENERKQTLAQANQEVKEQERQLRNLQEVQKEIAAQLKQISEQTLGSISQWSVTELVKPVASIDSVSGSAVAPTASKRGRKPGIKNQPKAQLKPVKPAKAVKLAKPAKSAKPAKPAKLAKPAKPAKSVKLSKPAKPTPEATSAASKVTSGKRGPKPKAVTTEKAKPAAKRGPKPKISLETVSDEGLPTLNKVLEAYAKSSGPRGKVGEIN